MRTEQTSAKGIRLPDSIWETIDQEARALGMNRNEYLARRLRTLFAVPADVQKMHKSVRPDDIVEVLG